MHKTNASCLEMSANGEKKKNKEKQGKGIGSDRGCYVREGGQQRGDV